MTALYKHSITEINYLFQKINLNHVLLIQPGTAMGHYAKRVELVKDNKRLKRKLDKAIQKLEDNHHRWVDTFEMMLPETELATAGNILTRLLTIWSLQNLLGNLTICLHKILIIR